MLFMVIERFKNKDPKPIGARFKRLGRMLPDGVTYHASWIDPVEARCFQVMAAAASRSSSDRPPVGRTSPISKSCQC